MKTVALKKLCVSTLVLLLAACSPTAVNVTSAPTVPAVISTDTPLPTITPEPVTSAPSFTAATYRDETAGFELDYPADWTVDPSSQIGVRGAQALLLSPGTTLEALAEGGSRLAIMTYMWDPKHDLSAYVAQRMTAWEASGFAVTAEETWTLTDGRQVQSFTVQSPGQPPAFFVLTTIGEDYLQLSGEGDLALIEEIVHTLRPTA
jgi:hypothetical protein